MDTRKEQRLDALACFRCGYVALDEEDVELSEGSDCPSCNEERTIVSFNEVLDILNDFYVKGIFKIDDY